MAIYRGIGGSSEANQDGLESAVTEQAQNAASSASDASSSATAASNSATAAASSASAASSSATTASGHATAAGTSETNAATSATAAGQSEINAAASETAAATSETNAAASAASAVSSASSAADDRTYAALAATSALNSSNSAASSETAAAASASAAATSATNAATSETNAASSESAAEAAKDAALAALDSFDDRYLGQKASDPTLDNDGNALVAGALYFDTTSNIMKVYDGSQWLAAYASLSGALIASNNLSDLNDAATARTNLGLGTAATTASTDYATAAQGALADSAVQPADNISTLTNDSGYITTYTVTSGDVTSALGYTPVDPAGDTMTGNLSFGDNDKAIFGAGSDLQIYHSGTESWIQDAGTGTLYVEGTDLVLRAADNSRYLVGADGNATYLYHPVDDAYKVRTTSTGIDVTGTVTADGVTSAGNVTIQGGSPRIEYEETDNPTKTWQVGLGGGNYLVVDDLAGSIPFRINQGCSGTALSIASNNDISFYEDTGTTAKFFWDASAESLGIGTSSPDSPLTVRTGAATDTPDIRIEAYRPKIRFADISTPVGGGNSKDAEIKMDSDSLTFSISDEVDNNTPLTERMRIDSSGNLKFDSGYGSAATAYGCRAWVNFNGTGTVAIRTSGNVSSITDNGTGNYTVNFTTAMPDTNYTGVCSGDRSDTGVVNAACGHTSTTSRTTSAYQILNANTANGIALDGANINIAVFR